MTHEITVFARCGFVLNIADRKKPFVDPVPSWPASVGTRLRAGYAVVLIGRRGAYVALTQHSLAENRTHFEAGVVQIM